MEKEILAAIGVDLDAVAGWIGSYSGADSPSDIQRGVWAGEVGTPRLLRLFEKYGLRTSWFIPGHSIETVPDQVRMVAEPLHVLGRLGLEHVADVVGGSQPLDRPCLYVGPLALARKLASWLLLFLAEAYTGTVLRAAKTCCSAS